MCRLISERVTVCPFSFLFIRHERGGLSYVVVGIVRCRAQNFERPYRHATVLQTVFNNDTRLATNSPNSSLAYSRWKWRSRIALIASALYGTGPQIALRVCTADGESFYSPDAGLIRSILDSRFLFFFA